MKHYIRLLSILLCIALLLPCSSLVRAAETYTFLDYTRVYGSKDRKRYDVECSFGTMTVPGKLLYTGEYSIEQINAAAEVILGRMGKTPKDMEDALLAISDWEEAQKITDEDAIEIADNIAKILGKDADWDYLKSMPGFVEEVMADPMALLKIFDILEADEKQRTDELIEKYTTDWLLDRLTDLNEAGISIGSFSLSQKDIFKIIFNTMSVSLQEWLKDKERWADRVDAVNAQALLKAFYDALNLYLNDETPDGANWVLTAAGQQARYFRWFGSSGNIQYISLALTAHKSNQFAGLYAYRGNGANLPYGTYQGSAAIKLTHDLSGFDSQFWNLPIGIFQENWLTELSYVSALAGGAELKTESKTQITRDLTASDITFTIPGGYSYQYNSTIPATPGNRDVYANIPLDAFQDIIHIKDTHTLSYRQGLGLVNEDGQLGGLEAVAMELRASVHKDMVSITGDNLQAYCNIAGIELADVDQNGVSGGSSFDDHIWAEMGQGLRLKIKLRR